MCPINGDDVIIQDHPVPLIIDFQQNVTNDNLLRSDLPRQAGSNFDLNVISINIWAFNWPMSEEKDERMDALIKYLENSDHDIVFLQEVWMQSDFQKIKKAFPYSSYYGSPGSKFCPQIRNDQALYLQLSALDCNGLAIMSRHPILHTMTVSFDDRIQDQLNERLAQRAFAAATVTVSKIVNGVTMNVKVSAVDSHLTTWYEDEVRLKLICIFIGNNLIMDVQKREIQGGRKEVKKNNRLV